MEENKIMANSFMSEQIDLISAALSEFQGAVEQPRLEKEVSVRTKAGGTYKFRYADLSACVKAAAPTLKANGLSVTQVIIDNTLITLLSHKSGQWFKSELKLPAPSTDYQSYGSAITYLKRYSYCAILGLVADTDDDANLACGNEAEIKGRRKGQGETSKDGAQDNGTLLQQALTELEAVDTEQAFQDVWAKWAQKAPTICANGTEFYNKACTVMQKLKKSVSK